MKVKVFCVKCRMLICEVSRRRGRYSSFCDSCTKVNHHLKYLSQAKKLKKYRKAYRLAHLDMYVKSSHKWWLKQRRLRNKFLDDVIANPRKYLDDVGFR